MLAQVSGSRRTHHKDQEGLEMQFGLLLDRVSVVLDMIVCRRFPVRHLLLEHFVVHGLDLFRCHVECVDGFVWRTATLAQLDCPSIHLLYNLAVGLWS